MGGRCTEIGLHGVQIDWGPVRTWPISPTHVPRPDPANASIVAIAFHSLGLEKTEIIFDHAAGPISTQTMLTL